MKTFSQFMIETGGSPYQPYKPKPQPEPSPPPPGFREKYVDPIDPSKKKLKDA